MSQWDDIFNRNSQRLVDIAAITSIKMGRSIIKRSPVDKGTFQNSWKASINFPDISTSPQPDNLVEVANQLKFGDVLFFTNNQPYALRLEYGWSKQAPSGMVRLTVADFQGEVARTAKVIQNPVRR